MSGVSDDPDPVERFDRAVTRVSREGIEGVPRLATVVG